MLRTVVIVSLCAASGCASQKVSTGQASAPTAHDGELTPSESDSSHVESQETSATEESVEQFDGSSLSDFEFLMSKHARTAATSWSYGDSDTREWRAVHSLVEAGAADELREVAESGGTAAGRVLGLAGLYRLDLIDENAVADELQKIEGELIACSGCLVDRHATAADMLDFVLHAPPPYRRL